MESHRLKPMASGYDEALFNSLYKSTEKLRNKLVYGIDHRRFGLEVEDVKSWFDTKFIFVFSKYSQKYSNPDILKAHIINSLQLFKYRVLRKAYTAESLHYLSNVGLEDSPEIDYLIDEPTEDSEKLQIIFDFFKSELTRQAYDILMLKLYPPDFITEKLSTQKNLSKISPELISEFFDIPMNIVRKCLKDIKEATSKARILLPGLDLA